MVRRVVLAALFLLVPSAWAAPQELIPGLTYERKVDFTPTGPVVVNVLTVPRPGGLWSIHPVLSNETIPKTEKLTAIERRLSPAATVAAINGDLFGVSGAPTGILMRSGGLDQPPVAGRSSIGIDSTGALRIARVAMLATWQGSGPRRALAEINAAPKPNGVSLYTPAWGPATPAASNTVQVSLSPFPLAQPNVELISPVVAVSATGGTSIPADGAVLVARGTAAQRLQDEAPAGRTMKIRLILKPSFAGVVDAIGGGPALVKNGRPIFRAHEQFRADQLLPRAARSAVGQLRDGRFLFVTIDGSQPGYSAGATNFELALEMVELGAVTAAALDAGRSAQLAFEGKPLSRLAGPERPIADALVVAYAGIYLPQPLEPVLSPNGDGIAERQRLAYKLVRQSQVTASLIGPDGTPRESFNGTLPPGTYPFDWPGKTGDGSPEVEGRWRWVVSATDDRGQTSGGERDFDLNDTLGFPSPSRPALAVPRKAPRAVAGFRLTRAAVVTSRIKTTSGVVLRSFPRRRATPGDLQVWWDGSTDSGATVYSGRYVAEATAINELGTVTLDATFAVRRLPPPPPKPKPATKKPATKKK
jgi:hypothetical protein